MCRLELIGVPQAGAIVDISADSIMVDVVVRILGTLIADIPETVVISIGLVRIRTQEAVVVIIADSVAVEILAAAECGRLAEDHDKQAESG